MDYGRLLSRAWEIIWENKFLILLGVLVALSSGGNSTSFNGVQWQMDQGDFPFGRGPRFDLPEIPVPLILLLIGIFVLIGLALWVASTIARGGLIAGVNEIDAGGSSSFGEAWRAGWEKGWRLIGIGLVPSIPGLLILLTGLGVVALWAGASGFGAPRTGNAAFLIVFVAVLCILGPIALILNLLRVLANRACMLEDRGVFESYGRGIEVLTNNLGAAVVLFFIQVALTIGIGLLMIFPGLILVLCCLLWPLLVLLQGAISAYFSSLWTLAWREWTGAGGAESLPVTASEGGEL